MHLIQDTFNYLHTILQLDVLENSADEFEDSEEVYDAIGAVLHEVSSDKSEDEIK